MLYHLYYSCNAWRPRKILVIKASAGYCQPGFPFPSIVSHFITLQNLNTMESNSILNADVLDIIFENRNKNYGAYQLRKTYNKRLTVALSVMFGVCLLVIAGSVLASNSNHKVIVAAPVLTDVNLSSLKEKEPEPIIPPKPKELPKFEQKQFVDQFKFVKEDVTPPPAQSDLDDVKIGQENVEGLKGGDVVAPPVEAKGAGPVVEIKHKEDFDGVFESVQVQAKFPGGPDAWQKFLERNLKQDVPVENGAPPADYKIVVSFIVDKEGNVTEIRAENDPGYGIASEAIRVIQRSGKWVPALQNGRNVIYRQMQTIIFRVSEQ